MNKRENSLVKMAQNTLEVINQHKEVWTGKVAFGRKVDLVTQHIVAVELLGSLLSSKQSNYAADKNAAKELMGNAAFDIAAPLLTFARDTNKSVLAGEISFHQTELTKGTDMVVRNRSQLVGERAQTYLSELADYDITTEQLTALKQRIATFNDLLALPRAMSKTQQTARTDQRVALKNLTTALDDLDNLMVPFRNTHASFYQTYTRVRQVINQGSRTVSVQGKVTDFATNVALPKVEVNVDGKAKQFTSAKGNFRLFSLAPGTYRLQISREGYATQTIANVTVQAGKIARLEVSLVKG